MEKRRIFRYGNFQIFFLLLCIVSLVLTGCGGGEGGGGGGDSESQDSGLNAIVISPKSALLTKVGETRQFTSTAYYDDGTERSVNLTWSSSNPDAISVDQNGLVTSLENVGSALITASFEGVVSNEVMAVVASTVEGAVLVSDEQIVSEIVPEDPEAEWGLGLRYQTTLSGIGLPQVGTILISTGEKPLSGKIVSAVQDGDKVRVIIETVAIDELFADLIIDEEIDLSKELPTIAEIFTDNYDITWHPDGTLEFTLKEQTSSKSLYSPSVGAPMGTSVLNPDANYGPFTCEASFANPFVLDAFPTTFIVSNNLSIDFDYQLLNGGLQHLLLKGDVTGTFKVSNTLSAILEGKIGCQTKLGEFQVPFPGVLASIGAFYIPVGVGFEVDGKITLAQIGFEFTAKAKAELETGWQCPDGSDCDMVANLDPEVSSDFKWITPDYSSELAALAQIRLEPSVSGFVSSNLEIGPPPLTPGVGITAPVPSLLPRAELLKMQAGLKQAGNFAIVEGQMDDESYSSNYALSIEGTIEAGSTIDNFAGFLNVNLGKTTLTISTPLAESPKALSAVSDVLTFKAGDIVKFSIDLDPQYITYPIYGYSPLFQYNPFRVIIYRKTDDGFGGIGPADFLAEKLLTQDQTLVQIEWSADIDDTIGGRYFAFAETKALPFPYFEELEIAKISPPSSIILGTLEGNFEGNYEDYLGFVWDYKHPIVGTPVAVSRDLEISGGQSEGSLTLLDNLSYMGQTSEGSITASLNGNSLTFDLFASVDSVLDDTHESTVGAEAAVFSKPAYFVLDNTTNENINIVIDWIVSPTVDCDDTMNGNCSMQIFLEENRADSFTNDNVDAYFERKESVNFREPFTEEVNIDPPSGQRIHAVAPGRHCLRVRVSAGAGAAGYTGKIPLNSGGCTATISGAVQISIQ